jgi:hypothetical protein
MEFDYGDIIVRAPANMPPGNEGSDKSPMVIEQAGESLADDEFTPASAAHSEGNGGGDQEET